MRLDEIGRASGVKELEMNRMRRLITALTVLAAPLAAAPASAKDLATMTPDEIRVLQQRLTDAKCYTGPIDGKTSPATEAAKKSCPDQDPELRIETGMHTAMVNRIAGDESCSILASAADDNTVRLWSLPDGKLEKTIRLPFQTDQGSAAYAVALSSDRRWLAAGGWDPAWRQKRKMSLNLVDQTSGAIRRIGAFESTINGIAFSPDKKTVAVSLGEFGIRALDIETGREIFADRNYGDSSYDIKFTTDGGLFTASYDGFIRRYDPKFKLAVKKKAADGSRPHGLSIDPSGARIAIGYEDTNNVSILDGRTLEQIGKSETDKSSTGSFAIVAWSRDGTLWAAGQAENSRGKIARRFSPNGRKSGEDTVLSNTTILTMASCGDGLVYGGKELGFISRDGAVRVIRGSGTVWAGSRGNDALAVSVDGRSISYGRLVDGLKGVLFDSSIGKMQFLDGPSEGHYPPKISGINIRDWEDGLKPTINGRAIELNDHEYSRRIAIRADDQGFVLASSFYIRSFDSAGAQRWRTKIPVPSTAANLSRDGKIVVVGLADGTIRWYRWSDGKELLALFLHKPDKRWVAWTPSGYYMASPGGEDLFGWHMNRGWEQAPDFFPASRFRDRFSRPDIVQKVLTTLDEDAAVAEANAEAKRKPSEATPIETRLPPVVRITSPKDGSSLTGATVTLDYGLRSPSGLAVDAIDVLIDGRPLAATRGVERVDEAAQAACPGLTTRGLARSDAGGPTSEVFCRLTVPVPSRAVEIGLIARAGQITSVPALVRLTAAAGSADTADVLKPKLYILAVGVSDYADPNLTLRYAGADAVAFAKSFEAQKGGIYREVVSRVLTDRDAGRVAILEGLEWLERQVTARDVAMVFLAGHGMPDEKGSFWYLPADARPASLRSSAVSQEELRRTLQSIPSKAILFLDACHAGKAAGAVASQTRGQVDINTLVNELSSSENGVVTFASSTGRELSEEHADWGHGAFTKALIEGIGEGRANLLQKGTITLSELDAYVVERVKTLTAGRQHSVMTRPATISNFPVALVK